MKIGAAALPIAGLPQVLNTAVLVRIPRLDRVICRVQAVTSQLDEYLSHSVSKEKKRQEEGKADISTKTDRQNPNRVENKHRAFLPSSHLIEMLNSVKYIQGRDLEGSHPE